MIDVVYLAYSNEQIGYGIEIVEKFLNTYKSHSAGIEHNLVFIAKNWTNKVLYDKLCDLAKENNIKIIDLPDDGLDFGAYFRVSKILQSEYVFFLGSNTEIISDNWLLYSYKAFENDKAVQLVGPMGSWDKGLLGLFPNYHIRTCFFMINRKIFLEYAATQKFPQTKDDTWKLEHGEQSLTKFIFDKGYKAVVVNSDGEIFTRENWISSKTYTSPDECKSMMMDKWSKRYYSVSEEEKIVLEALVWGKNLTKYPKNLVNNFSEKINIFTPYVDIKQVFTTNVFHPLFLLGETIKLDTEAFQDNTGINIANKNKTHGELTGYYWIWKNYLATTNVEYIGFCQFQRFLDFNISNVNPSPFRPIFIRDFKKVFEEYTEENILNCIQGYDVILPEKTYFDVSLYEEYLKNHSKGDLKGDSKEDIEKALGVIKEIYPEYFDTAKEFMSGKSMYIAGSFVMKKELLNEFIEWLFNILPIVEEKIGLMKYFKYKDLLGSIFGVERFFNIWLMYNIKTKNLKVKSTTSFFLYYDLNEYMAKCLEEINGMQIKG